MPHGFTRPTVVMAAACHGEGGGGGTHPLQPALQRWCVGVCFSLGNDRRGRRPRDNATQQQQRPAAAALSGKLGGDVSLSRPRGPFSVLLFFLHVFTRRGHPEERTLTGFTGGGGFDYDPPVNAWRRVPSSDMNPSAVHQSSSGSSSEQL